MNVHEDYRFYLKKLLPSKEYAKERGVYLQKLASSGNPQQRNAA